MAKDNPARDYTNKLAVDAGFSIVSNYTYRGNRQLVVSCQAPVQHAGFKQKKFDELAAAGFVPAYFEWSGEIKNGELIIACKFPNNKIPGYVAPAQKEVKSTAQDTLPESVAN